ncbi:zinc ribbon domain-containing protein [Caloramator sp. E03]|uniref:zinc ribbon domain-containing protein n=1 Tax=Caloramator sp. E03 TaxID=2576307 RepID=UPI00143CC417|nr:C4-type zinc ribbon domain-containing protein [Caloramator sp. E03]
MDLDLLFEVSRIDEELKDIEKDKNIKATAIKIRYYKETYENYKNEYNQINRNIKELENLIKDTLKDIESLNKEVKEAEERLYSSNSLKTIDACQKLLENKKADINEKEERVYNYMEKLDAMKVEKEKLLKKGNEVKESYNLLREEYMRLLNDVNERIKILNEKRELITEKIMPVFIEEYERIKNIKGYGMCLLNGEICSGCGIDIPTAIISDAKDKRKITKCPHCGVILYVNE